MARLVGQVTSLNGVSEALEEDRGLRSALPFLPELIPAFPALREDTVFPEHMRSQIQIITLHC